MRPQIQHEYIKEKTWVAVPFSLPRLQAFALPFPRISNAVSPRRAILHCYVPRVKESYNTPDMDVAVAVSSGEIKVAKFEGRR